MVLGLILFADGFEDSEGITTRDILCRGGINMTIASISDSLDVVTSHGIHLKADALLKDLDLNKYDFLILPGGLKGTNNIANSKLALNTIKFFYENKKGLFAICAAPSILGKLGYLDHLKFTCFPGFEKGINGQYTGEGVTIGNEQIITGKSMFYSYDFALTILKKYAQQKDIEHVLNGTKGLK